MTESPFFMSATSAIFWSFVDLAVKFVIFCLVYYWFNKSKYYSIKGICLASFFFGVQHETKNCVVTIKNKANGNFIALVTFNESSQELYLKKSCRIV